MLDEEEKHLQKGSDGKVHVFLNGIFTTPDETAGNAVQMAVNKNGHLYFTYHPQAKDWEVELGIAIYEYFGGWSNSSKKFQDFITRYGNEEAIVSAHSRGSLTVGNGLRDFEKRGIHGLAEKTDIYLYGPADNSLSIANAHYYVSDGKKDHIYLQSHAFDPIGTVFGGNPATTDKVKIEGFYVFFPQLVPMIERGKAVLGYNPSPHKCYGNASPECGDNYGSFGFKKLYSTRTGNKK